MAPLTPSLSSRTRSVTMTKTTMTTKPLIKRQTRTTKTTADPLLLLLVSVVSACLLFGQVEGTKGKSEDMTRDIEEISAEIDLRSSWFSLLERLKRENSDQEPQLLRRKRAADEETWEITFDREQLGESYEFFEQDGALSRQKRSGTEGETTEQLSRHTRDDAALSNTEDASDENVDQGREEALSRQKRDEGEQEGASGQHTALTQHDSGSSHEASAPDNDGSVLSRQKRRDTERELSRHKRTEGEDNTERELSRHKRTEGEDNTERELSRHKCTEREDNKERELSRHKRTNIEEDMDGELNRQKQTVGPEGPEGEEFPGMERVDPALTSPRQFVRQLLRSVVPSGGEQGEKLNKDTVHFRNKHGLNSPGPATELYQHESWEETAMSGKKRRLLQFPEPDSDSSATLLKQTPASSKTSSRESSAKHAADSKESSAKHTTDSKENSAKHTPEPQKGKKGEPPEHRNYNEDLLQRRMKVVKMENKKRKKTRSSEVGPEDEDGWDQELRIRRELAEKAVEYGIQQRKERMKNPEVYGHEMSVLQRIKQDAEEILRRRKEEAKMGKKPSPKETTIFVPNSPGQEEEGESSEEEEGTERKGKKKTAKAIRNLLNLNKGGKKGDTSAPKRTLLEHSPPALDGNATAAGFDANTADAVLRFQRMVAKRKGGKGKRKKLKRRSRAAKRELDNLDIDAY